MGGAGSIQFMISSFKANRSLLKRKSTGKYQNFDTSYITDYPISGKKKRISGLPKATPAYMSALKKQLKEDRGAVKNKNRTILAITTLTIVALAIVLFSIHF